MIPNIIRFLMRYIFIEHLFKVINLNAFTYILSHTLDLHSFWNGDSKTAKTLDAQSRVTKR